MLALVICRAAGFSLLSAMAAAAAAAPSAAAQLTCCQCGDVIAKASEMLLVDGGVRADLPGRIWGCCQRCSGVPDKKEFKRMTNRSWRNRSHGPPRARDHDFNECMAKLKLEHPGASKSSLRELAINWALRKRLGHAQPGDGLQTLRGLARIR